VSDDRPTAGETVSFSASTPDGVRSFQWDLDGDGRYEASGRTATAVYPTAGTRTTKLQVTASDGSTASSTRTIAVAAARCKGRGCPAKKVRRQRVRRRARTVRFRQLERSLRSGTMVDIRVFSPDHIGKYTRFRIRKGQAPLRYDTCVQPGGKRIMQCPGT
jgi:hypothetical protein